MKKIFLLSAIGLALLLTCFQFGCRKQGDAGIFEEQQTVSLEARIANSQSFKNLATSIVKLSVLGPQNLKTQSGLRVSFSANSPFSQELSRTPFTDRKKMLPLLQTQFNNPERIFKILNDNQSAIQQIHKDFPELFRLPSSKQKEVLTAAAKLYNDQFFKNRKRSKPAKNSRGFSTSSSSLLQDVEEGGDDLCGRAYDSAIFSCALTAAIEVLACSTLGPLAPACYLLVIAADLACSNSALIELEQCRKPK